ncbi:MAG: alpha-amylase family glycosyl hydrolase [Lachnospiraceae bacterium]|nr:alpha-amylase family glycosyl hydrolase [Lachnospiraceae bacterium]
MWAEETVFYQIYPLGFCGAPFENDGVASSRILKVIDWIDHLKKLNIGAVYFSPVFESDTHGYNTRDFNMIDTRLGSKEDFKKVCDALHEAGIKVVLDAVFNHVGRGFWAFKDVLEKREGSSYVNWFGRIDFGGNSNYNDGLWYEGWEGNYDLVKLNLYNEDVVNHLLECVTNWVRDYDIDGLRLDVAYCLTDEFCRRLRSHCDWLKPDFFLVGEVLHGEYGRILDSKNLHSVTNYQCYKGIHSAFNSENMFEIIHSLLRLFGPEDWTVARGRHLLSFCDNHDVTRIASIINNENCLKLVYAMVFGMPGIPCIYYGSEWGTKADKSMGDPALRPSFDAPSWNELTDYIAALSSAKRKSPALNYGGMKSLCLQNKQCVFERECEHERVLVAINMDSNPYTAYFDARAEKAVDLISGEDHYFAGGSVLEPYSAYFWKIC